MRTPDMSARRSPSLAVHECLFHPTGYAVFQRAMRPLCAVKLDVLDAGGKTLFEVCLGGIILPVKLFLF